MLKALPRPYSKRLSVLIDPSPIEGLLGWRQAHLSSVGSTNDELTAYARSGRDANRLWLTAGEQKTGKGRRGRKWLSPPGNFHGSVYLHDPCEQQHLGFLPLICAVAVHKAIVEVLKRKSRQVEIKWPNDVLVEGAKCCGMLIEADHSDTHIQVVIGCGINLVAHPDDTPYPATDFKSLGVVISPNQMLHYLAASFDSVLAMWDRGNASQSILDYWTAHARGIGDRTIINLADKQIEGVCEGINARGFLLLREPSGRLQEISAGDVFYPHMTK